MLSSGPVGVFAHRHRAAEFEDVHLFSYEHCPGSFKVEALVLELLRLPSGHLVQHHDGFGKFAASRERAGNCVAVDLVLELAHRNLVTRWKHSHDILDFVDSCFGRRQFVLGLLSVCKDYRFS